MTTRILVPIVFKSLAIALGGYAMADEPPVNVKYEERPKGTQLTGSTIPDHIKYQMFVANYDRLFGHSLVQEVSQTDHAILADASSSFNSFRSSEQGRIDRELTELCARRGALSGKDIALKVDRIYDAATERRENHFKKTISRLSAAGQTRVQQFIDDTVADGMQVVVPPPAVQLQEDDPEEFDYWLELECHRALTGDYPAEVNETTERVMRQIREGTIDSKIKE